MVSVITCFLDAGKYLAESIESVLGQTYENWELILVNDGSSDDCAAIAAKYVVKYPEKIIYLTHPGAVNKGLSPSRNLGIANAKGRYVCFLDADDIFLPNKLRDQVMVMEKNAEADLLMEATMYWYSWNDPDAEDICVGVGAEEGIYTPTTLLTMLYPLGTGQAPCVSSLMVRLQSLHSIGLFSDAFIGPKTLFEDQAFLCQYYLKGKVYVSDLCNSKYRQREDSCVSSVKRQGLYREIRLAYFVYLRQKMKQLGFKGSPLLRMVNREILELSPVLHCIRKLVRRIKP